MTVGNTLGVSQLNQQLASLAIQICIWAYQAGQLQEVTTAAGTAGLEAAGFSAGDAATYATMVSYLNTVAGAYLGTATQGSEFNFDNALCLVRGGQVSNG